MIGFISFGFLVIQSNASLPDAQSIKSVELKIPLRVYSAEGLLISEFGDERRKPVAVEDIPETLINAVLASEDDGFYDHRGIDISGLIRAAISNFRSGQTQQGASTITMQVARNFFLSREKTYTRKLKEVLLAIKLEQILSKDEILSLYLNKIFLGHRAYGFGAAAEVYYGRELSELTLAESAMLAGLPKAPSSFNPLRNPERAVVRRNYVLGRLRELDLVSEEDYEQAVAAPVTAEKHAKNTELDAPHIAEMVRAKLIEEFGEEAYWAGFNVHTTVLAPQQQKAETALRAGLQSYDRRHGFRGAVSKVDLPGTLLESEDDQLSDEYYTEVLSEYPNSHEQVPALVLETEKETATVFTRAYGRLPLFLKDSRWARRHLTADLRGERPESMAELLSAGEIIYIQPIPDDPKEAEKKADTVAVAGPENPDTTEAEDPPLNWRLSQIPNVSGALISVEPRSGRILSLVGGYDFFLNKYNRAVQSIRQPGSNIKPFIYSASLNKGFTPASLISGAPIVMTDPTHGTVWRPENYSGKFFGPTRMREALAKSLNLVSIRLLRTVGIPYVRSYLERFGIDMRRFSPTLTMALGAGGVTPLEMLRAYSTLANSGYQVEPYFIDYITDRHGEVIYEAPQPVFCDECYLDYLPQPELTLEETQQDTVAVDATVGEQASDEQQTASANDAVDKTGDPLAGEANEANESEEPERKIAQLYTAPRVMTRANNFLTVSMLKDVVRRGTARKALALNRHDLAGKTGTTNDYVDAWFSGFNSRVATTVWVGFDEPATLGKGEAGSVAALPIWIDYMSSAMTEVPQDSEELPAFMAEGLVDRVSGKPTDEEDPDAVVEYFPVPALLDFPLQELSQDEVNAIQALSVLATEDVPVGGEATALEDFTVYDDDSEYPLVDGELTDDLSMDDDLLLEEPINSEPRIIEEEEETEGLF